jgi:lipoprotein-releasing system permease protein
MNRFFFLLSWRLIRSIASHHTLHRMARWCFLSIMLSTGALALIAAITHGIEQITLQKVKGLTPDIVMSASQGQQLNYLALHDTLTKEFSQVIQQLSPVGQRHVIVQNSHHPDDISTPVVLTIIDPPTAFATIQPSLTQLCQGHHHQLRNLPENSLIIGEALAQQLHVTCGDTILMRYPAEQSLRGNTLVLDSVSLKIAGIFSTGLSECDTQVVFIPFATAEEIFEETDLVDHVYLKLQSSVVPADVKSQLMQRFGLSIVSWEDLNPALLAAMKLEKMALILILSLITLMTAMSTMSLISIFVLHHQRTIALLRACGITTRRTTRLFMTSGFIISCSATLLGLCIASVLSYLIDHYQLISLPDIYYSSYLPAHMTSTILFSVFALSSLVSFVAIWYPTRQLRFTSIRDLLIR